MIKTSLPIYLASKSPRRRKLLNQINLKFKIISVEVDEKRRKKESPVQMVKRLSIEKSNKARQVLKRGIIITADTTVVLDGKVIGKPENKNDAVKILTKLSGKTHIVYTGFTIFNSVKNISITDYEKSLVKFRILGSQEIKDYVATGSPLDKAGAYGIQDDFGAVFIEKINGCYYNVVGLPLPKVYQALKKVV